MKIAFTSCSNATKERQHHQPVWGIIHQQQPDLLLLLGDNVYIGKDGYEPGKQQLPTSGLLSGTHSPNDILELKRLILRSKYEAQVNERHFKNLLADVKYLPVWDNHDFGLPGNRFVAERPQDVPLYGSMVSPEYKEMVRKLFDEYLKNGSVKPNSDEVYCDYTVEDDAGKKITFLMLDVRSYQENPKIGEDGLGPDASLLGLIQEGWLLEKIESSDSDINVICSGLPYTYWRHYKRWLEAFKKVAARKPRLLFLAGQVHHNEFNIRTVADFSSITESPIHGGIDPQKPQFSGFSIEKTTMYEAISSGVGHNFRFPGDDPEDEEPYRNNYDIIDNPGLMGCPRNNYGIVDFTEELVVISLYGQLADDMHYAVINRRDWILTGYWSMRRSHAV